MDRNLQLDWIMLQPEIESLISRCFKDERDNIILKIEKFIKNPTQSNFNELKYSLVRNGGYNAIDGSCGVFDQLEIEYDWNGTVSDSLDETMEPDGFNVIPSMRFKSRSLNRINELSDYGQSYDWDHIVGY